MQNFIVNCNKHMGTFIETSALGHNSNSVRVQQITIHQEFPPSFHGFRTTHKMRDISLGHFSWVRALDSGRCEFRDVGR